MPNDPQHFPLAGDTSHINTWNCSKDKSSGASLIGNPLDRSIELGPTRLESNCNLPGRGAVASKIAMDELLPRLVLSLSVRVWWVSINFPVSSLAERFTPLRTAHLQAKECHLQGSSDCALRNSRIIYSRERLPWDIIGQPTRTSVGFTGNKHSSSMLEEVAPRKHRCYKHSPGVKWWLHSTRKRPGARDQRSPLHLPDHSRKLHAMSTS